MSYVKTCRLPAKTHKNRRKTPNSFVPYLTSACPALLLRCPIKSSGLRFFLDFIDRGHSLPSLPLPPAAVGSLPHHPGRQAHRRGNLCFSKRSHHRLRHFHRKYVKRSGITRASRSKSGCFSMFISKIFRRQTACKTQWV